MIAHAPYHFDIDTASIKQQKAYLCLNRLQCFDLLSNFNPLLVGTIPIEIDIPSSDLDIICDYQHKNDFIERITSLFKEQPSFSLEDHSDYILAQFKTSEFPIEVYATNKKVYEQAAYIHMCIEHRLLHLAKKSFKEKIIALKLQGIKTEPAFGKLLKLSQPYEDLLQMAGLSDEELISILQQFNF